MSLTVLRTMFISLVRDRGALALTFILPVAFFVVFAAIFAGGSGDAPRLSVAIADEGKTEESARLVRALARDPAIELVDDAGKPAGDAVPDLDADRVRALVRDGKADAGLIVRADVGSVAALMGEYEDAPPLTLVEDSAKGIAAQILLGLVQKTYMTALPDVTARGGVEMLEDQIGPLTPGQKANWDRALGALRKDAQETAREGTEGDGGSDFEASVEIEKVTGRSAGQNFIAYYAGAVATMFLLFAAVHGAVLLLEERDAGILERILAGPGGVGPLLAGKFLFLVIAGFVQVTMIFVVAWLLRGVDLPGHAAGYAIVTLAASAAAAGLALALTAACRSKRQANSVATIGVLILSAVGGSMVPRFFMPPWIQKLGWLTPNTWALEAYTDVFWRDAPLAALALPVAVLLGAAAAGYAIARTIARGWESF
jgi:ABC-2 type transport system permease protein